MKAVLLLLVLGLSGLLYVQWEIAPEQPPDLPAQRGAGSVQEGGGAAATEAFALGDPHAFDVISQRPLFTEGRRPPEAAAPVTTGPQQQGELKGLDLSTVLITPQRAVAWVRDAEAGELIRLQPGEKIRGWKVQMVEPHRLQLVAGEQKAELELRVFPAEAAPPAAPARPVRPGARPVPKRPIPPNRRPRR